MYVVREEDKARLITLCGLEDGMELPKEVEDAYWKYKRYHDRAFGGQTLSADALVRLAMVYTPGVPRKEEYDPVLSAFELAEGGNLKNGDPVRVKYRNQDLDAVFMEARRNGERCLVRIGEDERWIRNDLITAPQPV